MLQRIELSPQLELIYQDKSYIISDIMKNGEHGLMVAAEENIITPEVVVSGEDKIIPEI